MQSAYSSSFVEEFLAKDPVAILGQLSVGHSHDLDTLQRNAWASQITLLQRELAGLDDGWIAFEFAIPRMGKRVDNIVLFGGLVFVLEFKVGAGQFDAAAKDQVVDYALDLKNFHAGSHALPIVPVVVATKATASPSQMTWSADDVAQPVLSNGEGLGALIKTIARDRSPLADIHPAQWASSGYRPNAIQTDETFDY
jgi:hypothetical protein